MSAPNIQPAAAGYAALVLTTRLYERLVATNVLNLDDAHQAVRAAIAQIEETGGNPAMEEEIVTAIKQVFPGAV